MQKILELTEKNEILEKENLGFKEELRKVTEFMNTNNEKLLLENENLIREEMFLFTNNYYFRILSSDMQLGLTESPKKNENINYFTEDVVDENIVCIQKSSIIPTTLNKKEINIKENKEKEVENQVEIVEKNTNVNKKALAGSIDNLAKSPTKKLEKIEEGAIFFHESGVDESEQINFMKNKKMVSKNKFQVKKTEKPKVEKK